VSIYDLIEGEVFVIATSAKPKNIDPALRRPGRIDKEIEIGVPGVQDREEILRHLLTELNIDIRLAVEAKESDEHVNMKESLSGESQPLSIVDIKYIASRAHGMVGSDLLLVCKEALLLSSEELLSLFPENDNDKTSGDIDSDIEESFAKLSIGM
jgi:AAA family ATPase